MKTLACLLWLLPLGAHPHHQTAGPPPAPEFATLAEAKAFFYGLDDQHNRAMIARDSAFFARHYAPAFYNCTPLGGINNKAAEIQTQLHGPWVSTERIAPQLDVFAYAGGLASLVVSKRTKVRTPTGVRDTYVRRTVIYQKTDGQWQAIAGQVTYLLPQTVGL